MDVGTKGKLGGQAVVEGVEGTWQELTAVVNKLAENLTTQVRVGGFSLLGSLCPQGCFTCQAWISTLLTIFTVFAASSLSFDGHSQISSLPLSAALQSIAEVTKAVAKGDLSRKIEIEAQGEIAELKTTINVMVSVASLFSPLLFFH